MPAKVPAKGIPPMLYGLPWGISQPMLKQELRRVVTERGWQSGTFLEDQVALILSRFTVPKAEQQYRVGRYRLDFAWPQMLVGLEADGWWHRSPEGAVKDRERDSWLRSQGWVIFRVDDQYGPDGLAHQLLRVAKFLRSI